MAASRGVDELLAMAGLDPADGVQIVAANRVASVPFDPALPLLVLAAPTLPLAGGVVAGRHARTSPLAVLTALYPSAHPMRPLPGREERSLGQLTDAGNTTTLSPKFQLHNTALIIPRLNGIPWQEFINVNPIDLF